MNADPGLLLPRSEAFFGSKWERIVMGYQGDTIG